MSAGFSRLGSTRATCARLIYRRIYRTYFVYERPVASEDLPSLPRKERLILDLLISHGPLFGLQLVHLSEGRLKRGTVYATLTRMQSKGYLESEQETLHPGAIGLPRRFFRPTALGVRVRKAWVLLAREFALEVPR